MARDQWQQIHPGEILPGLPHEPWNKWLDDGKGHPRFRRPGGMAETSIEFDVVNNATQSVPQFGILSVGTPLNLFNNGEDADNSDFFNSDTLNGTNPQAGVSFVVVQDAASTGDIVRGRLMGVTRVKLNVAAESDTHAGPTTSTTELTTAASGPARILWKETGTGAGKWGVVNLLGDAATPVFYGPESIAGGLVNFPGQVGTGFGFDIGDVAGQVYEVVITTVTFASTGLFPPSGNAGLFWGVNLVSGQANIYGLPASGGLPSGSNGILCSGWGSTVAAFCLVLNVQVLTSSMVRLSFAVSPFNSQTASGQMRYGVFKRRLN